MKKSKWTPIKETDLYDPKVKEKTPIIYGKKPREFWIEPEEYPEDRDVIWFTPVEGTIHVREVLPIDWEKVWNYAATKFPITPFGLEREIQELVEKALKGELE